MNSLFAASTRCSRVSEPRLRPTQAFPSTGCFHVLQISSRDCPATPYKYHMKSGFQIDLDQCALRQEAHSQRMCRAVMVRDGTQWSHLCQSKIAVLKETKPGEKRVSMVPLCSGWNASAPGRSKEVRGPQRLSMTARIVTRPLRKRPRCGRGHRPCRATAASGGSRNDESGSRADLVRSRAANRELVATLRDKR